MTRGRTWPETRGDSRAAGSAMGWVGYHPDLAAMARSATPAVRTLTQPGEVKPSMTPSSVLMVIPRWMRDGGVAAHVKASAAALADRGVRVEVAAARVEPDEPVSGVTVHHAPELFNARASIEVRLGEALASG